MAHLCKYCGETVENYVPRFCPFSKVVPECELVNVWNNCVATVELNCGVTVEQKSVKNSFSVPHYGTANSTIWSNYGIAYSTLWNNHLINQPEIPHYGTFDLRGERCNSILWNKIYVVSSGGCHMQLFSDRHWLPLNHTIYADRKRDFSQLDLKDRILSAVSYSFNLEK